MLYNGGGEVGTLKWCRQSAGFHFEGELHNIVEYTAVKE